MLSLIFRAACKKKKKYEYFKWNTNEIKYPLYENFRTRLNLLNILNTY